ncbi:MAG: HD domain-containing protein [Lachnospiraceae bacterium]|nr:HD domain-containing protein [Lachnospiraceae bacterium]
MKYIETLSEGMRIQDIYLCKERKTATTKNGKPYDTMVLMDKTGSIEAKIWNVNDAGIADCDALDFVDVTGEVTSFNGALQVNVSRVRKVHEGEYNELDYVPQSEYDIETMYGTVLEYIDSVKNPYLNKLLHLFLIDDEEIVKAYKKKSAAKTVHHGFVGGLLQHSVTVAANCKDFTKRYKILNYDLLITAALLHDIGKIREFSDFPLNDYTEEGNLLGHIVMGSEMISEKAKEIEGFPPILLNELKHCILSHHGELEFGSPKKPAIAEAMALNFADNIDAKMETLKELFEKPRATEDMWMGYIRSFDGNIRKTSEE